MNARQLKNSILQMAVQGKLVPQDPNDEPASVLLERIRAEKQRLIRLNKEGKIKKDKNETVIYRGARTRPSCQLSVVSCQNGDETRFFERTADGAERDITEELPFDIPETWELCRLADIVRVRSSKRVYQNEQTVSGIPFLRVSDLVNRIIFGVLSAELYISEKIFQKLISANLVPKMGDILVTSRGTLGLCYIVGKADVFYFQDGMISWLDKSYGDIDSNYLAYQFGSEFIQQQIKETSAGTAVQYLSLESLKHILVTIPPLAEQRRIVERIEQLLPHIAEYDDAEQKLTALNAAFPDQIKKSILQAAVQGKLVEQNPNDEPASLLLERIRAEKQRLIKEGKIKKDKRESVISRAQPVGARFIAPFEQSEPRFFEQTADGTVRDITDELPFDVPESWEWCRLETIISVSSGKGLTTTQMKKDGSIPVYGGNGVTGYHDKGNVGENTLVIGRVGFYCGATHITKEIAWVTDNALIVSFPQSEVNINWLRLLIDCAELRKASSSTAQPLVSRKTIYPLLAPLPPLAEQNRIVAKCEELLSCVDRFRDT